MSKGNNHDAIIAYSNLLDEEDMAMECYTEVEETDQVADLEHCNMSLAIPGKQAVHTRGLQAAAVGPTEEACGMVVVVDVVHRMGEGGRIQALLAREADNMVLEDEDGVHFEVLLLAAVRVLAIDGTVRLEGKDLCFCGPGNLDRPFVAARLPSFLYTECFGSLRSHCIAA